MIPKSWILLFAAATLTSILAADLSAAQSVASKPWEVNISLLSSIYLPTPRPVGDVYFELNNTTPDLVYRIESGQAKDPINLGKMAYATTNTTRHDVYKLMPNALGPFPKGKALRFTLEQWLAATGLGTYIEENDNAALNLTFHNLVPNGTYSVWSHRVTMPPDYNYSFTPVGASDGSQNVFKADADGNGIFKLKLKALPPSTNITYKDYVAMYVTKQVPISTRITWTLIAVAYHSDGKTHGPTPGELGKTTHMQMTHLMYPKPIRTYEEWRNATRILATTAAGTDAAEKPQEKQPGFEGLIALAGLLAVAYLALHRR